MKRMSEEFKLPLKWVNDGTVGAVVDDKDDMQFQAQQQAGYSGASRNEKRQSMARAAAHAINHVDALADALDNLIKQTVKVYSNSKALGDAENAAIAALEAYRGDK